MRISAPRITVSARAQVNVDIDRPPSTLDGWVLLSGDFVWLTNQTDPSQNGITIKSRIPTPEFPSGRLIKATELDIALATADIHVLYGTQNGGKVFHANPDGQFVAYLDGSIPYSWVDGFSVDIEDFLEPSDGLIDLTGNQPEPNFRKAWIRAHDSGAAEITFKRRKRYGFDRACEIKRKINVKGYSTLNVANNTELRFRDSYGFHFLFADTTPDTQGGWSHIEGLLLRYMGSFLEEQALHALNIESPCTGSMITTQDFPGHGLHSIADVNSIPKTGANLLRFEWCRFYQSGLSGIYLAGGDANASHFEGMDTTGCGKRNFGAVKTRYVLKLTNTTGIDRVIVPGRQVWKDTRYGLYYMSVTGGVVPAGGTLNITIESYNRSLEAELKAQGLNVLGSGTQFGWGTEYNQPLPNTITTLVYSDESLTGVTFTNPSGPAVLAVHGDHHGIWDNAFLGNTFETCHSTAPGGRHYLCLKGGGSEFNGCYCEIGNFGEVVAPNHRNGGLWGDPPGMQSNGTGRDTSAYLLAPALVRTGGPKGVTLRICRNKSDEVFNCTDNADPVQGLRLQRSTGGPLGNSWAIVHTNQQVVGFTEANDQRHAGHFREPRGPIIGNPGCRFSFVTTLPTQSIEEGSVRDVWNVGDVVLLATPVAGAAWLHRLTTKVLVPGTQKYNLTWTNALNAP